MSRVLPFPTPPDDPIRTLLNMAIDDLQILKMNDVARYKTAMRWLLASADAVRATHTGPVSERWPDDDLQRMALRLLALYDPPQLHAFALEVADLAQPIRIRLAGHGPALYGTLLLPLIQTTLMLSEWLL